MRLDTARTGRLDGTGAVVIGVGPTGARTGWQVTRYSVTCDSVATPRVEVYRNTIGAPSFIEGTLNGGANVSAWDVPIILAPSERLLFLFQGGDPGALATVTVSGITEQAS